MRTPLLLSLLLGGLLAAPLAAQVRDSTARMERVGDGVYVIIHDNATDEWPHGNTGVIVGEDAVAVIDATYLPSRARADIALIRRVTPKPVRYLIYTHWHFDHNNGGIAYREAFPGVAIVSQRDNARFIEVNGIWWSKMSTQPTSAKRAGLARMEEDVARGADSSGHRFTADELAMHRGHIRQRRAELQELASLKVVTPDLLFDGELTLPLGHRVLELRDRGKANSPHDVTVWLPQDRVLFSGDILVQDPFPYTGASWPVPWVRVLRDIEATPIAGLVPGHGPVMRDHRYTRLVRELMEAVTARVDSAARRGLTLEQVQDSVTLEEFRTRWPADDPESHRGEWRTIVRVLVERAWRGVRGQG
jgi:glyoxylase-like metal-dependent hydrolase (beta-lactamase superfamily II)